MTDDGDRSTERHERPRCTPCRCSGSRHPFDPYTRAGPILASPAHPRSSRIAVCPMARQQATYRVSPTAGREAQRDFTIQLETSLILVSPCQSTSLPCGRTPTRATSRQPYARRCAANTLTTPRTQCWLRDPTRIPTTTRSARQRCGARGRCCHRVAGRRAQREP